QYFNCWKSVGNVESPTRWRPNGALTPVCGSEAPLALARWGSPLCPAGHRPIRAQPACGKGLPSSSAPLPRSLLALLQIGFRREGAGLFLPALRQSLTAGSVLPKSWPQSTPRKSSRFRGRDSAGRSGTAAPVRGRTLLLQPAFESVGVPRALPRAQQAPAWFSLRCAVPPRLYSAPRAKLVLPIATAVKCASPIPNAKCGWAPSARKAVRNSPRAASLRLSSNPSAAPDQLNNPHTAEPRAAAFDKRPLPFRE